MNRLAGPAAGLAGVAAGLGAIGYVGYNSLFTVQGGERAVIYNRVVGVREDVFSEGMHVILPWFERATIFDVRTRPRNLVSLTGSKDLQMVNLNLRVLSKPDVSKLPEVYRFLGPDYNEKVMPSVVNEVAKSVVARYNASELLTRREQVSREIREDLEARLRNFYILLDDVSITDLRFGAEYTSAVEAKQVAQQDAERARYVVERARQEKEGIIVRAKGEAESAILVGKAIKNNPGFVQLRRIDAARSIAETVSRSNNGLFLSANSLLLDVMNEDENVAGKLSKRS